MAFIYLHLKKENHIFDEFHPYYTQVGFNNYVFLAVKAVSVCFAMIIYDRLECNMRQDISFFFFRISKNANTFKYNFK